MKASKPPAEAPTPTIGKFFCCGGTEVIEVTGVIEVAGLIGVAELIEVTGLLGLASPAGDDGAESVAILELDFFIHVSGWGASRRTLGQHDTLTPATKVSF